MPDIFHVLSRGVDKRKIFLDQKDYFRFIHNLFELNDEQNINSAFRHSQKSYDIVSHREGEKPRKLLVQILAFCLMPNHYHLLLSPQTEKGISKFMKKLNIGYAKYFNIKYGRKGTLFESRFKSMRVNNEKHFIHLPYYIHLNPLDLRSPEWRTGKIQDYVETIRFLESYRWSSHLDYMGKKNFPSITHRDFLTEYFGGNERYANNIKEWLLERVYRNISAIKKIMLEYE